MPLLTCHPKRKQDLEIFGLVLQSQIIQPDLAGAGGSLKVESLTHYLTFPCTHTRISNLHTKGQVRVRSLQEPELAIVSA